MNDDVIPDTDSLALDAVTPGAALAFFDWSTQSAWAPGAWSPGAWSAGAFAADTWIRPGDFGFPTPE